jgi:hypothetical protein
LDAGAFGDGGGVGGDRMKTVAIVCVAIAAFLCIVAVGSCVDSAIKADVLVKKEQPK